MTRDRADILLGTNLCQKDGLTDVPYQIWAKSLLMVAEDMMETLMYPLNKPVRVPCLQDLGHPRLLEAIYMRQQATLILRSLEISPEVLSHKLIQSKVSYMTELLLHLTKLPCSTDPLLSGFLTEYMDKILMLHSVSESLSRTESPSNELRIQLCQIFQTILSGSRAFCEYKKKEALESETDCIAFTSLPQYDDFLVKRRIRLGFEHRKVFD